MDTNKILASSLPERKGFTYASLFNPLSPLLGGGDRIPEWAMRTFPGKPETAWLASKTLAVGFEAALLAAAYRGMQHINTMSELSQNDDPDKKMEKEIGTTFNVDFSNGKTENKTEEMPKKAAESDIVRTREVEMPHYANIYRNTIYSGLPIAAFVLAAAAGYNWVDKKSDQRLNEAVTEAVANKNRAVKNLMQARARVAKGTITEPEVQEVLANAENAEPYVKQAAENDNRSRRERGTDRYLRAGLTSYGLLAAALYIAATGASYKYFKAADKNNIRYKAMKKGLMEYTKNKVVRAPLNIVPTGQNEFFDTINNGARKEVPVEAQKPTEVAAAHLPVNDVRGEAEIHEPERPISVTL